jgi:hypothetical protein
LRIRKREVDPRRRRSTSTRSRSVGGTIEARLVNHTAAPIEGEVTTVARSVSTARAAPAPEVVTVPGNGGSIVVRRSVADAVDSCRCSRSAGGKGVGTGDTVALLPSKDAVAVAFVEDRRACTPEIPRR